MNSSALIEVDRLERTYATGRVAVHALRGVSFTVERGELVAIMGPSGSGKTTMMNILGCLDRPSAGHYRLNNRDVSAMTPDELADVRNEEIGFVFQGFNLLARTSAADNVELPLMYGPALSRAERRERALECLQLVGLADRAQHLPTELSGGEQQRVAIARALVNRPSLVLADEPTGNLDTHRSEEILALFQHLNRTQGITVVMVTHEPDIAACCRRVLRFRDGALVGDEPVVMRQLEAEPACAT
jgi:putative ABC transport system ATP-binding protein